MYACVHVLKSQPPLEPQPMFSELLQVWWCSHTIRLQPCNENVMQSVACDPSTNQSNQPQVLTENGTRWSAKIFKLPLRCFSLTYEGVHRGMRS